jgi:hypothetical protein
MRGPKWPFRALPYPLDGALVGQSRCFEKELHDGTRFRFTKPAGVGVSLHMAQNSTTRANRQS